MQMEIKFPGGKRVDALYKGFEIKTDQSQTSGGNGSAPAPFDLFMASIATCAGIYVLSFCQERSIPTENLRLLMNIEKNHNSKMIGKIKIDIVLPPEFPEKYKTAVIKSAELCAVVRHMQNPPEVEVVIS